MKSNHFFRLLLLVCLLAGKTSYQQTKPAYKLPDSFSFDYEVVQVSAKKNASDTSTVHYFYTKSGDYAGLQMGSRHGHKENKFMIFTKEGNSVIIDDDKKSITIINMRGMIGDLANMASSMSKDSSHSPMKSKLDPKKFQVTKTGNTKQVSGYTTEEYRITDSSGRKTSIWYAKVDFNAQAYYLLGMGAGDMSQMGKSSMAGNPLFQTLSDPKTLITELVTEDTKEGKGTNMHTQSINSSSEVKSTKGYKVNDYSNMDLKEMMQQGGKKNAD